MGEKRSEGVITQLAAGMSPEGPEEAALLQVLVMWQLKPAKESAHAQGDQHCSQWL